MRFPSFAHALFSVLGIGCLVGCGGMGSFPSVDPGTSPIGSIHGVNMGGHAPLVGAHIYLLEAGTTGYGSLVKSLITSGSSGATANGSWKNSGYSTDLFVPSVDAAGNPFYGLTTDSGGGFNLTGDYTCDVGQPVYLVGVGGNPGLSGTPVTVTSAQVLSRSGTGSSETATVGFVFSSSPSYSTGTTLLFSGFSGSFQAGTGINGTTSVVTGATGNTVTVTVPDPNGAVAVGAYSISGTATPSFFNHAAVNVAVLGTCPANGTFAGTIPIIIMNEISTVAAAYVFQPYLPTSGTNQTGIDEFHIGSSNTALGLQGIQNAAAMAASLYDITGSNGTINSPIARSVLPFNSQATVPQAEIDGLGNILAGCVDSGNTYRGSFGTLQASCKTLFQYASSNGVYDTSAGSTTNAFNTFQAAVNIARFPQGNGTGTTTSGVQTTSGFSTSSASNFTAGLYALETGTVPFTPNLHSISGSAPNSFLVFITIVGNGLNSPVGIAIDGSGNVWVANNSGNSVSAFTNGGIPLLDVTGNGLNGPAGLAIDGSGNVWVSNGTDGSLSEFANGGFALSNVGSSGLTKGEAVAIDGFGNVWVGSASGVFKFSSSGGFLVSNSNNLSSNDGAIAIDGSGNVWGTYYGGGAAFKISNSGASLLSYASGTTVSGIALDGSGSVWVGITGHNSISKLSNSGTLLFNNGSLPVASQSGMAIDGLGNAWLFANSGIAKYSSSGVQLLFSTVPNVYASTYGGLNGAIDGSGNVWAVSISGSLFEIIGAALPVITPLCAGLPSTASSGGTSNLGTLP